MHFAHWRMSVSNCLFHSSATWNKWNKEWSEIVSVNHWEKVSCHYWGAKLKQISKGLGPQAGKESFYFQSPISKCGITFCLALVEMLWNHIKTISSVEFDKVNIFFFTNKIHQFIYLTPFMRLMLFPLCRWCHLVDILFHARSADKFAKVWMKKHKG